MLRRGNPHLLDGDNMWYHQRGALEHTFFGPFGGSFSARQGSQILQVNTRWKALDEIYKIYMLLHRSDLKISKKNASEFFEHYSVLCDSEEMIVAIFVRNTTIFSVPATPTFS